MNPRGGWALICQSLFQYMSNRGFFWTLAFLWMTGPLVYLFVWTTAANQGAIGGFRRDDFIFYYLCLIAINQFTYPVSNWAVGDSIHFGWFSAWLLRPLPVVYEAIAIDLATKMVCMPFTLIMTFALGIFLHPSFTPSIPAVLAFVLALLLAQVLRFLLAYVLALFYLWSDRVNALLRLNDTLVFLLAGQVAPIALLPGVLKVIAIALPYRYMMGFPIELLMGKLDPLEIMVGFGWQVGWLMIIVLLHNFVWQRGLRHYTAVGG